MIEFYVSGQTLKFYTPVIAADTLNYLTAKVNFADAEWDGYSKWLHFRQDEELGAGTYDIPLNEDNEIVAEDKLNLTVGQWEIYLTGTKDESRLTTVPVILTVKESGLIDAPLHELPMSVAERVDFNAKQALLLAQAVKNAAEAGAFDGKPGTSFAPLGYYPTLSELEVNVINPAPGDVYGVGEGMPYDMYSWDGVNLVWINNGPIQGAAGEKGEDGAVFIPSVDSNGNIFWTNNGGLENPITRNIRGPKGEPGAKGEDGKSPLDVAREQGFSGTDETFYQGLTLAPFHNSRHLPDGGDPIVVKTGNLEDKAITRAKLAQDALYSPMAQKADNYAITAADIGNTIRPSWNTNLAVNLTQENSSAFPVGAEIAIFSYGYSNEVTLTSSGVYFLITGEDGRKQNITVKISDTFGMIALKKVSNDSAGNAWLVTGNVEVVS